MSEEIQKPGVIVSLSGGLDSATLLAKAASDENIRVIKAVGFTYGSKHNQYENAAARRIAHHYKVELVMIDLTTAFAGFKSALMKEGDAIPEGYYESESMRQTVVPARNLIFGAILTGIAVSCDARGVLMGIHAGDHHIYPDCRPRFAMALNAAIEFATDGEVMLGTPYIMFSKKDILKEGLKMNVPYHLTRTCYKDQEIACGKCGSCQERLAAFAQLGITDPLEYESRDLFPVETYPVIQ